MGTLVEEVDAVLQAAYPEFITTREMVEFTQQHYASVYRALVRLEHRGLAVRFKLDGCRVVAWAMRSVVGT